jgi:hypothetical protein
MSTVKYRPRNVIKRNATRFDPVEIGIAFDCEESAFYVCPPDMSSKDISELTDRWYIFLKFVELLPTFEVTMPWFGSEGQREGLMLAIDKYLAEGGMVHQLALKTLKEDLDKGVLSPVWNPTGIIKG